MAKTLGDDYRLFVKDAAGNGFSQPRGQGNCTIGRSSGSVPQGTKDNGAYEPSAPGAVTLTITQEFIPDLPDAPYARMKAVAASRDTTVYQIRYKPFADANVEFECLMYTVFGDTSLAMKANRTSTATLSAAEAPTKDDL